MSTQAQEFFRAQPEEQPRLAGANIFASGLDLLTKTINGVSQTAQIIADPLVDFASARQQIEESLSGKKTEIVPVKSQEVTNYEGLKVGSLQIPKVAVVIGGFIVVGITGLALYKIIK